MYFCFFLKKIYLKVTTDLCWNWVYGFHSPRRYLHQWHHKELIIQWPFCRTLSAKRVKHNKWGINLQKKKKKIRIQTFHIFIFYHFYFFPSVSTASLTSFFITSFKLKIKRKEMCLKNAVRWFSFPTSSRLRLYLTSTQTGQTSTSILSFLNSWQQSRRWGQSGCSQSLYKADDSALLTDSCRKSLSMAPGWVVGWWDCRWHPNR